MRIPSELRRRFAVRLLLALVSFWVAVSIIFLLTTGTVGDSVTQKLTNLENQGAETRLSEVVGEIEVGVTNVPAVSGQTIADIAAEQGLPLADLLTLNPERRPEESLPHGARVAVLSGEWLSDLAIKWRVVRPEDVDRGVALLRERNPEIEFPVSQGRPYAPTDTILILHRGVSVAELAEVQRITAADILEVNPAGSAGNPDGTLTEDSVLRHGDPIALPLSRITAAAIRYRLGIDRSLGDQYAQLLWDVARFDYSSSFQTQEDSLSIVGQALPRTVQLNLFALIIALTIGMPLGWLASGRAGRLTAIPARSLAVLSMAAPSFWIAMWLIVAVDPGGILEDGLWNIPFTDPAARAITDSPVQFFALYSIPAFSGGLLLAGALAIGRSRGSAGSSLLRSLRVWIPVFISLNLVLELLFNIPGLGLLLFQRVNQADMPVMISICAITSLFIVWCLFVIDCARDVLEWKERRT